MGPIVKKVALEQQLGDYDPSQINVNFLVGTNPFSNKAESHIQCSPRLGS